MKTITFLLLFVLLNIVINAQMSQNQAKTIWSAQLKNLHAIIENKGQEKEINGHKILYAYYDSKEKFYFTEKGLIVKLDTTIAPQGILAAYYRVIGEDEEWYKKQKELSLHHKTKSTFRLSGMKRDILLYFC